MTAPARPAPLDQRPLRGLRAVLAMLAVLTGVLASSAPASADANWFLTNGQDQITNRFGSSDVVFASGSAVGGVGLIPSVDLYVTANHDWTKNDGVSLDGLDVSNAKGIPNTAFGFEVIDLPIFIPYLAAGSYDVVVDTNMDGVYEADTDDVIGEGPQPGFTVYFDGNTTAIDKDALKQQFAAPWQNVAQFAHTMSSMVKTFSVAEQAAGAAQTVAASFSLGIASPTLESLSCIDGPCSTPARLGYRLLDHVDPVVTSWNTGVPGVRSPAGICKEAVEKAFPSNPLASCSIPKDPTAAFTMGESFGEGQLDLAAQNLDQVVGGIIADPPDPNFKTIDVYAPPKQPFTPPSTAGPTPALTTTANDFQEIAIRSRMVLNAMQRFDGANAAGDAFWAGKQATAMHDAAIALIAVLQRTSGDATKASSALDAAGESTWFASHRTQYAALQQRLTDSGWTADERTDFHSLGWTDDDLDALKADVLKIPAASLPDGLGPQLASIPPMVDGTINALWSFANQAGNIAGASPKSTPPIAAFVGSTPDATHPLRQHFDGAGSTDPDGTVVSYAWDFGDGTTGTGRALDHTYLRPGFYTVVLTVTDDSGTTNAVTQGLGVNTAAPLATITSTTTSGSLPLHVAFDGGASTDSDGTIASYAWNFGDGATADGPTATHDYTTPGSYTATLTVTDDLGATGSTAISIDAHVDPADVAPVAAFTMNASHGLVPFHLTVDASTSTDSDGHIVSYDWDFGDGTKGTGKEASFDYTHDGSFIVSLTVTDNDGATATTQQVVTVTYPNRAPVPGGDSLSASPTGALDVLANDADPDGDPITAKLADPPTHGTATCSAKGACFYVADAGYVGGDSFSYDVSDPSGLSSRSIVSVDVTQPAIVPRADHATDDVAATLMATPVTIDVLANDHVSSGQITGHSDPAHGVVSCLPDGHCTFTPTAGFRGTDGFTYDATSDAGAISATVTVTVGPAAIDFAPSVGTGPADGTTVAQGSNGVWTVGAATHPGDLSDAELEAAAAPTVSATVSGAQDVVPGSITFAKGWAPPAAPGDEVSANKPRADAQNANTITATAGAGALLGDTTVRRFPRPLPPISQGSGGDGHVPILVGTKIFAFFHHSNPTSVSCVDRATGHLCPGYPHTLNFSSSNIIGAAAIVGTQIWVHGLIGSALGLSCWDTATDRSCGLTVVDRSSTDAIAGSAPVFVDGNVYVAGSTGRLYCVDPSTHAACASGASIPSGLDAGGSEFDIISHGTRVFTSNHATNAVGCVDVRTAKPCSGWATPKNLGGKWNLVNEHDATGATVGVCGVGSGSSTCVRDDAPADLVDGGWVTSTDDYYDAAEEAETGTRTFVGSLSHGGLACWDWTTSAVCAGAAFDSSGWASTDTGTGIGLPSAYGAAWDGSCVVGLGDPGQAFTMSPDGESPCTSLEAGTHAGVIDLRDQRCDGTVGGAAWRDVSLVDTAANGTELTAVRLTIVDGDTGVTIMTGKVSGGEESLDLSSIDPAKHPAIKVLAVAEVVPGSDAWGDGVPPGLRVRWVSDPAVLCVKTLAKTSCSLADGAPATFAATVGAAPAITRTVRVSRPASCDPPPTPTPAPIPVPSQVPQDEPLVTATPAIVTPIPPPAATPPSSDVAVEAASNDLLRTCSKRKLVLVDVYPHQGKVHVLGLADPKLVGQKVSIVRTGQSAPVVRPIITAEGTFAATAPLPPAGLRARGEVRYRATMKGAQSLNLKLDRRLVVTTVQYSAGAVLLEGRVVPPLPTKPKDRQVTISRQTQCGKTQTAKTFDPGPKGNFSITLSGEPAGAIYRLQTRVRRVASDPRTSATFSLPRAVEAGSR